MSNNLNTVVDESIEQFPEEFTRKNIESLSKYIRLVDSDAEKNIDLFCYLRASETDPPIIKQCRGVVFHGDELVMKGFPYTIEYTKENVEEIGQNILPIFDQCTFYDSHEGSVIRMFNYDGKWFLSTNRKLNAFSSKWSSRTSFGSAFQEALEYEYTHNTGLREIMTYNEGTDNIIEKFQDILDKKKQYMFLLLNNDENRIVCDPPSRPTFFHVGTFVNSQLIMDDDEEDIKIPKPLKHTFANIDELFDYVNNRVNYMFLQGVIVFTPGNKQYKIFNSDYKYLYNVRGNELSINFRYLQIRMDKQLNEDIRFLYPKSVDKFEDYENYLYLIAKNIHSLYIERFIKKNYNSAPIEEFAIIKKCHSWHLENRTENKININKVIDVMNSQTPTCLNRMIKRYTMTKNNTDNGIKKYNHVSLLKRKPEPEIEV